jgi:pantetheine-phosphate adenylyltransferase
MRTALIPGTYDPITFGHLDVIVRSSQIFDKIIVGVASSQQKGGGPLFTSAERVELVEDAVKELENVSVCCFDNLLVDFASKIGASAIVKGLRVVTDFESEFQQAALNYHLNPKLETVFIMATPENMYLSSSMVKQIASLNGSIHDWVTPKVEQALLDRLRNS